MHVLGLTPATTSWVEAYGWRLHRERVHTRRFEDFTIDERPLRAWLGTDEEPDQFLVRLSDASPAEAAEGVSVLEFLLGGSAPTYDDGCLPLLLCPIDEDLWCGALGVHVLRARRTVTWRLGWHNMDDEGDVQRHTVPEPPAPESFTFDRGQHDDVLLRALARYRDRAGDAVSLSPFPPHRARPNLPRTPPADAPP